MQLRRRWLEGLPISRMPVDANPDLRYCLLHQQLQLINCCIARHKRRVADLAALEALSEYGSNGGHEVGSQACGDDGLPSLALLIGGHPNLLFAKTKSGELKLRLGADLPAADLRMLETGEAVYSPITQVFSVLSFLVSDFLFQYFCFSVLFLFYICTVSIEFSVNTAL